MKLGFSQQEIIGTAKSLGLPSDGFVQRRVARAFDLVATDKVTEVDDSIFRVHSQYDAGKSYIVNLNGDWGCDCPDHQKHTGDSCKHMIASMIFAQKHEANSLIIKDVTEYKRNVRRAWFIIDGERRISVWQDLNGKVCCNCGAYYDGDCEHKRAIREYLNNGGGNGSKVVNECGSEHAEAIQAKLNGQLDSRNDNGNGAKQAPSHQQLDIKDPFQESELLDIAQIEGRSNGELVHKLSNGEYVISYRGIMTLSEKHHITFEAAIHDDTSTVIAKGRCGTSERVSGKPINGNANTALELAKRNAARQLIPFAEIKAQQLKAKLEADFDWQKAKAKCLQYVTDDNLSIIIHELVKTDDLRQENPSHYNRIEWLIIHNACKKDEDARLREQSNDNDGGVNSPPSPSLDPKSVNNWSYNSPEFIEKCRDAIQKVRDDKVEAKACDACETPSLEMPLQKPEGKRKLQMDSKLRTFLIETDGTKKAISCREICEKFESNIVTRLRAGIDSGADLSTVELDD